MNLQADTYLPPALLLDERGKAHPLESDELERWKPDVGPLWIKLNEDNEPDMDWLKNRSNLKKDNVEIFMRDHNWPIVRVPDNNQLFIRMRVIPSMRDIEPNQEALLRFWIEPRRIITMNLQKLPHLQHIKKRLKTGQGPKDVRELLLLIIEFMAFRLADRVLRLRSTVVDLELAVEQNHSSLDQVHRLRRQAVTLQRFADPQQDLLFRLLSHDLNLLTEDHSDNWRAVVDYYQHGTRELDTIVDRIRVIEETIANRTTEQMNRRIYLLTLVSTLLLPLTLITGLLAVGVGTIDGNILGARDPRWFIGLCILLVLTGWTIYTIFRHRGLL